MHTIQWFSNWFYDQDTLQIETHCQGQGHEAHSTPDTGTVPPVPTENNTWKDTGWGVEKRPGEKG